MIVLEDNSTAAVNHLARPTPETLEWLCPPYDHGFVDHHKEGRYGESVGEKIIGIEHADAVVITRCLEWTIEKNKGPLGPLEFCQ